MSVETVFFIGMDCPGFNEGGRLGSFMVPAGDTNQGAGFGTSFINVDFAETYGEDDIRSSNNIAKHNANNWTPEEGMNNEEAWSLDAPNQRVWKWHAAKPNNYVNDSPFDNPYIRYADVLLMYAKALNSR
ncbi:SusD family protein [Pricia antarctica]|uniref:SusD family protein n=1 Tax=Pricia antarctica TaxID=641691 RepID=A0A1G7HYZ7_9FLAO|nr:RagB/SusD family nutrient uptake outer membrane protein [Pricia antarctica]SDF05635.1 SusD family protein [Pricia antarctica]